MPPPLLRAAMAMFVFSPVITLSVFAALLCFRHFRAYAAFFAASDAAIAFRCAFDGGAFAAFAMRLRFRC